MIYLTGDIHGNVDPIISFIEEQKLDKDDIIVLLGDAGLNFYGNREGDGKKKQALNKTGVQLLCIHGNHEKRPQTIGTYKEKLWHGGTVYQEHAYPNIKFAKDGEVYDLDGYKAIAIGGAYSIDKYYRLVRRIPWFEDEQPSDDIKAIVENKLDELNWTVDIVLSHTCPSKYIPLEAMIPGVPQDLVDRSTEDWLDSIEVRLAYKHWYCGHWHINKTIDRMRFLMECKECLGAVLDKA